MRADAAVADVERTRQSVVAVGRNLATDGAVAVDQAVEKILRPFARAVTATGTRRRCVCARRRTAAGGVATGQWILTVAVAAAESSRRVAVLLTVAVGRTRYAVLAVSGLTHTVAAIRSARSYAVTRT